MRKFKSVESYKNLSILFDKNFMKQKVELVIVNIIKVYFDFYRLFISELDYNKRIWKIQTFF